MSTNSSINIRNIRGPMTLPWITPASSARHQHLLPGWNQPWCNEIYQWTVAAAKIATHIEYRTKIVWQIISYDKQCQRPIPLTLSGPYGGSLVTMVTKVKFMFVAKTLPLGLKCPVFHWQIYCHWAGKGSTVWAGGSFEPGSARQTSGPAPARGPPARPVQTSTA